jgi:hypothetical protein
VPPRSDVPPEYARLARTIETFESLLRNTGNQSALTLKTANEVALQALQLWLTSGTPGANELRVRANIIHGLAHAYSRRPNWRQAISVSSASVDMITPEPETDLPSTMRLYALASANCVVMRILEGSEYLEMRGAAMAEVNRALEYFTHIPLGGIEHWLGVVYTASAHLISLRGRPDEIKTQKRHAGMALERLDGKSELRHLALHLRGEGDGRVPGSGWLGSGFRTRHAWFSVYDLYHFRDQPLQS